MLSKSQVARAERLLGRRRTSSCVEVTNGFDPELFHPLEVDRGAHWAEHVPALAGYEGPVLLYVGRFTEVKRVPLLIEAYERARPALRASARRSCSSAASRTSSRASTRRGDRAHGRAGRASWPAGTSTTSCRASSTPPTSSCCPRCAEQFGQVLVEGMACGRPVIAVDAHGPAEIVDHGETGWLVRAGDDLDALADALVEAVNDPEERRRRGVARAARSRSSATPGPRSPSEVAAVYETALRRAR